MKKVRFCGKVKSGFIFRGNEQTLKSKQKAPRLRLTRPHAKSWPRLTSTQIFTANPTSKTKAVKSKSNQNEKGGKLTGNERKYDVEQLNANNISGDDQLARLFTSVEADIETALEKSELAANEKNRATTVALNAEIRRIKARLMDEVPKLQRLALKKVKGLTKEELATRNDLVSALPERIQSIPDGTAQPKQSGSWFGGSGSRPTNDIKFDSDGNFESGYFQQTDESNQFRQEYEMRKMKQDQGLDIISEGLDTLKNMASDMNEELDRQVPLMDEIDTKVDKATSDLKNTNVRLKETVNSLRSSRNFCIDIILLCVILGIAAYLYNVLKK